LYLKSILLLTYRYRLTTLALCTQLLHNYHVNFLLQNLIFVKTLLYEGNFLRKIKGISLALVITPFLFSGCMPEKVSTIIPVKSTDKKIVLDLGEKSQPSILNNDIEIKEENLPLARTYALKEKSEVTLLSEPIDANEASTESNSTNIESLVTQALTISNNWNDFSKEEEILQTAKKFLGVKYIWAANGPSAFDCSGFTRYVFKKNGINLPRYSGHQANIGKKISFSELQKGDLVFFDTTKKFTKKVNHVGIFIGNNKFIHASSGGHKVMITSFSKKKFYKNKFLYARRVINQQQSFALNFDKKSKLVN